jgi:hypothetical protein
MPPAPTRQNSAATNAQKYFRKADQAEASVNQMRRTERQATAAKTAKLRGLRLAKEEADKVVTDEQTTAEAATKPAAPAPRARAAKAKPAMKRMSY